MMQKYGTEENKRPEKLDVDNITNKLIGDFGRWQLRISILMSLLKLSLAWYQLNIIFMAPPQEFWCAKPESFAKYTDEMWRKICVPHVVEYPCLIFDPDILALAPKMDRTLIPLVLCRKFVYDESLFTRTITSDWNLVCERRWYIYLTQCVMNFGIVAGGIIFGVAADKYGRKKPLMITILIQTSASYFACVVPWFWLFLVNWFILALGCGGISIISFVLCIEIVGGKWRTIIPVLYQLPFGLGNAVLAFLAYWLRDWRQLEFALATISSVYLMYWFWIPESPRWLLVTGKIEKAKEILEEAAKENNMNVDVHGALSLLIRKEESKKSLGFMSLLRSRSMRRKTLLLSVDWFLTGLSFFTFSQYLGFISGNIFLTVAMSGIISIPGGVICLFIISKAGRKRTLGVFQLITTSCFIAIFLIPKDGRINEWSRLIFAGTGFAAMAGSVSALYLFSGELFPTVGRNVGISGVTMFARVASMVAPAVVSMDYKMPGLTILLLIVTSFIQVLILLPLPETKGHPLPDTLEEAEIFT
ncbi:unnamed protein product [Parnassius mnemosyne]|uniref:Major facilitator superfamily (MFS) profile domain-containing protein n=1 Tax=Parnassius mnemosyne TaxID=213953 RepID=A0AAV1KUN8_9NEOP